MFLHKELILLLTKITCAELGGSSKVTFVGVGGMVHMPYFYSFTALTMLYLTLYPYKVNFIVERDVKYRSLHFSAQWQSYLLSTNTELGSPAVIGVIL